MCGWVKNCIVTSEKFIFWCEKGYEWILVLGGPKTTYLYVQFLCAKVSNNLVAFCSTVQNLFSVGSHKCRVGFKIESVFIGEWKYKYI